LELAVEAGDRANAAYCLEGLAGLIAARDEPERATRLFGASEALLESDVTPEYPAGLSAREVEVLRLVANGMTNAQIAKELYISPRIVNAHLRSVYHKIGSSTRAEAARFASEHGLI
jgi:DNA-binding CsgD family transcriptional regulator